MSEDFEIEGLLASIKDNISQNKLDELASIAIVKMSVDYDMRDLLDRIKYKISPNHKAT